MAANNHFSQNLLFSARQGRQVGWKTMKRLNEAGNEHVRDKLAGNERIVSSGGDTKCIGRMKREFNNGIVSCRLSFHLLLELLLLLMSEEFEERIEAKLLVDVFQSGVGQTDDHDRPKIVA